jgi:hypothetical protein
VLQDRRHGAVHEVRLPLAEVERLMLDKTAADQADGKS